VPRFSCKAQTVLLPFTLAVLSPSFLFLRNAWQPNNELWLSGEKQLKKSEEERGKLEEIKKSSKN
jgi:hypothetical protein